MNDLIKLLLICVLINSGCENEPTRITIDCADLPKLLTEIRQDDQEIRMEEDVSKIDFDLMREQDFNNLGKVISIIEQCGMPTSNDVDKQHIETIFLVLQHSSLKYQKAYFSLLENSAKNGDLTKSSIAKLKDRMLVNQGKPQIYGTQLKIDIESNTSTLYEIEQPEFVNKRRKEVGLEPLQEYLKKYNIEFNVKQLE